jgi:hypothetical protein
MGFFDEVPYQDLRGRPGGSRDPPTGEFPCAIAIGPLVLARTESLAVAIIAVWAFQTGFEFWASAKFRRGQPPATGDLAPQESARVGLQFADGRKAASFGSGPEQGAAPTGIFLMPLGLSGGLQHRDWSYWAWPLPPAGPVTIVFEWAGAGIAEQRGSLDAELILDAARRSVRIWPGN